jgi:hypothetical protein
MGVPEQEAEKKVILRFSSIERDDERRRHHRES